MVLPRSAPGPALVLPVITVTSSSRPVPPSCMRRTSRTNSVVFDSVRRHQYGGTFVFHEERHEFRRFRLARVPPDHVNIIWTFIERLAGGQGDFLAAPHLHHD